MLQQTRTAGTSCDSTTEGIAMSADRDNILICSAQTNQWGLMKADSGVIWDSQDYFDRDPHDTGWDCTEWSRPLVSRWGGNQSGNTINGWPSVKPDGKCTWVVYLQNDQCCNDYGVVSFKAKYYGKPWWK